MEKRSRRKFTAEFKAKVVIEALKERNTLEEIARKNEYSPTFTKIEDRVIREPLIDYILAKPKENQIKDMANIVISTIGDMYPIPDQSIRNYVEAIFAGFTVEQIEGFLTSRYSYTDKIKEKIKLLAGGYAEQQFNNLVKIGKVKTQPTWRFPELLIPGNLGSHIANSLYEREGAMNDFEQRAILELTSLPNILFWHRNLERGKGFAINGFRSNHYHDFILRTKFGKIVIVETKGDYLDNTDSMAKCRLGNQWAQLAGESFLYFMMFDNKAIQGAYNLSEAKELIRQV